MPEPVALEFIGRTLLAMRQDMSALRDDVSVMAAILRRLDDAQTDFRGEAPPRLIAARMRFTRLGRPPSRSQPALTVLERRPIRLFRSVA